MDNIHIKIKTISNFLKRKFINNYDCNDIMNLTDTSKNILFFLFKNKDKIIYQKDLENNFSLRRATVSGILNNMEKKELIIRKTSDQDSRKKVIILSEYSLKLENKLNIHREQFQQEILKNITEEELLIFNNILDKIIINLKEEK